MSGYELCAVIVTVGALPPALALTCSGRPADRLVGVELTTGAVTVAMLLVSQVVGQSYDLVVPLVLVVLSVTGTLVFTRLLGRPPDGP